MRLIIILLFVLPMFIPGAGSKKLFSTDCREAYLYHFLNRACYYGDEFGVRILLSQGADPSGSGYKKYANCVAPFEFSSPLYLATDKGHFNIVKILLNAKADPNILEGEGVTPIVVAVERGNVEMVRILLKHGAKLKIKGLFRDPMKIANEKGNKEIIKLLEGAQK